MGDLIGGEGRLYVAQELVDAFRSEILPLASVLVPNQFEAELLSRCKITSIEDGFEASKQLQNKGPHTVVSLSDMSWISLFGCQMARWEECRFGSRRNLLPRSIPSHDCLGSS